jgi:hypothetical protein
MRWCVEGGGDSEETCPPNLGSRVSLERSVSCARGDVSPVLLLPFFITLGLEMSDTKVYEP